MPALKPMKNFIKSTLENDKKMFGCVIMASGFGTRFGGNKLMAELGGKPLIKWILDTTEGVFDYRVVVTRNQDVRDLCEQCGARVILHNAPGRNDTVRIGLEPVADMLNYCFFVPADQPFISRETFLHMIEAAKRDEQCILRSAYGDVAGAPVCFPKWTFEELLNLPEKKGGNYVVKNHEECVKCIQVSKKEELFDIDTKEDLQNAMRTVYNSGIK